MVLPFSIFVLSGKSNIIFRIVCSSHVTYAFQSESIVYSCLNVKEHLAWSRHETRSLSDCKWTRTHNHLVCKGTLNHLTKMAKWVSCVLSIYLKVHLTGCPCHVTYAFQSESSLYSCLNAKEFLAKWLSVRLRTTWF